MHLCAGLTAASWILEPFIEIGANFSPQLSSQTQCAKIGNKNVIAENLCEKHKNLEFNSVHFRAERKTVCIMISCLLRSQLIRIYTVFKTIYISRFNKVNFTSSMQSFAD